MWWSKEFPGGKVVRTPGSHCQGPGFNPWSGNKETTSHVVKERERSSGQVFSMTSFPQNPPKTSQKGSNNQKIEALQAINSSTLHASCHSAVFSSLSQQHLLSLVASQRVHGRGGRSQDNCISRQKWLGNACLTAFTSFLCSLEFIAKRS